MSIPTLLFVTSYPPRECGIATFSLNLIDVLKAKFSRSFAIKVCALECGNKKYAYPPEVAYTFDTSSAEEYERMAAVINQDHEIHTVVVQHEFGFFYHHEDEFRRFLFALNKPVIMNFHTVLPSPEEGVKRNVQRIVSACEAVIAMTENSAELLINDYGIPKQKTTIIPHGTHLVKHIDKNVLKTRYGLSGRKVLSTFGLLSAGKNIETTLDALPAIRKKNPEVLFLILGKTHPEVVKNEGEKYRNFLKEKVAALHLEDNVRFINRYLPLQDLLDYLQLTDIYLFTSNNPEQAVSGTFAYAMSCGCPIISTPIPHAREVLTEDTGLIIDFGDSAALSKGVVRLLGDEGLRERMGLEELHRIAPTAWENSAIAHAFLFKKTFPGNNGLHYDLPPINLAHIRELTTDFGMVQFSRINHPDRNSGYTIDDNARALIAMCQHYELTGDESDLLLIGTYLDFMGYCQQAGGDFLNYVDNAGSFTTQNGDTNLEDSNGRTIWALGFLLAHESLFPKSYSVKAESILQRAIPQIMAMQSPRAIAFVVKGLYYYNTGKKTGENTALIKILVDRLVRLYQVESGDDWNWFEPYLTYANSILSEAVLCGYAETGYSLYQKIARESFAFLLSNTFTSQGIKVISNKSWLYKGEEAAHYGEQPIDVAYTILALDRFYTIFKDERYFQKMRTAFDWFLGNNHLHRIIYNPCTGGCYDGLEEKQVNLNQGAESTLSYLMARLTMEKYHDKQPQPTAPAPTPIKRLTSYPQSDRLKLKSLHSDSLMQQKDE